MKKKIVSLRSLDGREAKLSSPAGPFTELVDASKYLYREMRLSKKTLSPRGQFCRIYQINLR